jgi:sortase A
VIRTVVRGIGELLITAGLLLLLFVAWQLWWTDVGAGREQRQIATELRQQWGDEGLPQKAGSADYGEPPELTAPGDGESFGLVHIPRFGADYVVPVDEGVGLGAVLNHGVLGHYPDTAMPGAVGNFSVAGHRVTYGRPLNQIAELQPGDPIIVETADAWFVYRMREAQIVTPDRVDVVAPVPGKPDAEPTERLMTLTACHPMFSARERYIVHAELDSWQPRSAGAPGALAAAGTAETEGS